MDVAFQCQAGNSLMSAKVAIPKLIPPSLFLKLRHPALVLAPTGLNWGCFFWPAIVLSSDDDCQSQRNQEYQVLAFLYSLNNCLDCFFCFAVSFVLDVVPGSLHL